MKESNGGDYSPIFYWRCANMGQGKTWLTY